MSEVDVGGRPAVDSHHSIASFGDCTYAVRFCETLCREDYDIFLISVVDKRFSQFYRDLEAHIPDTKHAVFSMDGTKTIDAFKADAIADRGHVSLMMSNEEIAETKLPPSYECAFNHATLQVLTSDRSWTYLEVAYPQPYDPAVDAVILKEYGDDLLRHLEFARERGDYQLFVSPLLKFTTREKLVEISSRFEELGCTIFDAHVYTIAEGGMKAVNVVRMAFKENTNPHRLMNSGKTSAAEAKDVLADYALETG